MTPDVQKTTANAASKALPRVVPRVVVSGAGAVRATGTQVVGFDASQLADDKALRRATPHVLFGVAAASEALRDARARRGSQPEPTPEECGLVCASSLGSTNFSYRLWRDLLKSGPAGASAVLFSEGVPNALAGHVARTLRLLGPGHMLGGGPDQGIGALAIARDLLESGRARRVVVAAAEEQSEIATRGYQRMGLAASPRREGQRRAATPGRALVPSEGAAAVVLELESPDRGAGSGGALATLLAVESAQLSRRSRKEDASELAALVRRTLSEARVSVHDVASITFWGSAANGTHVDAIEAAALLELAKYAAERFAPKISRAVRAASGDAFTVTPLLQVIEALPQVAEGRRAAVLSISPFGATTLLLLGPA